MMKRTIKKLFLYALTIAIAGIICFSIIDHYFPQVRLYVSLIYVKYSRHKTPSEYIIPKSTVVIKAWEGNRSNFQEIKSGPLTFSLDKQLAFNITRKEGSDNVVASTRNPSKTLIVWPNIGDFRGVLNADSYDIYLKTYGPNFFKSRFDYHKEVLETTPDSVSIFSPLINIVKTIVYLVQRRGLYIPSNESRIMGGHFIKLGNMDVIQMGEPKLGDQAVFLNLYPNHTTHHQILLMHFDQQEIDQLLSLIQIK